MWAPLPPAPPRAALWEDTWTQGQTGPWGGRGGEEEGPAPRSPPHARPWAGAALGGLAFHPAGSLLACSVGLAFPAWTSLWTGRGCFRAQASAPESRPQKPRGRTEALREEGHAGLTGRRAGVHMASEATTLRTSSWKGPRSGPSAASALLRPRRPLKTDGGSAPAFLRCSSRNIDPPSKSMRFSGLEFVHSVKQLSPLANSRTFPLAPRESPCPSQRSSPLAVHPPSLPLGPTLCLAGPAHAGRSHACNLQAGLRDSSFTPRHALEVPFSLFLQASGPASSLELSSAPCVDGPPYVYQFICQQQRAVSASWLLEHL